MLRQWAWYRPSRCPSSPTSSLLLSRVDRARRLYRAEGEKVLAGVLARSPAGRARQNEIEALNAALSSLEGRRLESVRVAMRIPGHFVVRVATDDLTLALEISPDSVAVESVTL